MQRIKQSALLTLPIDVAFHLIEDIEAYPDFLPWCTSSKVFASSGQHQVEAEIKVRKGLLGIGLRTRNTMQPPHSIRLKQVKGPFKQFDGLWTLKALTETACRVELELAFELQGKFKVVVSTSALKKATNLVMDAFCERARQIEQASD